jgi:hypothetical protein
MRPYARVLVGAFTLVVGSGSVGQVSEVTAQVQRVRVVNERIVTVENPSIPFQTAVSTSFAGTLAQGSFTSRLEGD